MNPQNLGTVLAVTLTHRICKYGKSSRHVQPFLLRMVARARPARMFSYHRTSVNAFQTGTVLVPRTNRASDYEGAFVKAARASEYQGALQSLRTERAHRRMMSCRTLGSPFRSRTMNAIWRPLACSSRQCYRNSSVAFSIAFARRASRYLAWPEETVWSTSTQP